MLLADGLTVIQTGSTNHPEKRIAVAGEGRFQTRTEKRLWQSVQAVGSLSELPVSHCFKSASFGTRIYIEANGERSPDLSCPGQTDKRVIELQAEAQELLQSQGKGNTSAKPK